MRPPPPRLEAGRANAYKVLLMTKQDLVSETAPNLVVTQEEAKQFAGEHGLDSVKFWALPEGTDKLLISLGDDLLQEEQKYLMVKRKAEKRSKCTIA